MVVANKTWEAEPLVHALVSARSRPASLRPISCGYIPEIGVPTAPAPRLVLACNVPSIAWRNAVEGDAVMVSANVQVWCIEDWMDAVWGNTSSSYEKMVLLPKLFEAAIAAFGGTPDVVVAFGTAGIPTSIAFNGCVSVGTRTFVHDPFVGLDPKQRVTPRKDGGTDPMWTDGKERMEAVLPSALPSGLLSSVSDTVRSSAESRFLRAPSHSAEVPIVLMGNGFASVSTINVTNYDDYVWADPTTEESFRKATKQNEIGSVETTHGLIRLAAEDALGARPRFLYVSGLTDSIGYFDMDVSPRLYAQNFAAAHNAGVALAWLLPEITSLLDKAVKREPMA